MMGSLAAFKLVYVIDKEVSSPGTSSVCVSDPDSPDLVKVTLSPIELDTVIESAKTPLVLGLSSHSSLRSILATAPPLVPSTTMLLPSSANLQLTADPLEPSAYPPRTGKVTGVDPCIEYFVVLMPSLLINV